MLNEKAIRVLVDFIIEKMGKGRLTLSSKEFLVDNLFLTLKLNGVIKADALSLAFIYECANRFFEFANTNGHIDYQKEVEVVDSAIFQRLTPSSFLKELIQLHQNEVIDVLKEKQLLKEEKINIEEMTEQLYLPFDHFMVERFALNLRLEDFLSFIVQYYDSKKEMVQEEQARQTPLIEVEQGVNSINFDTLEEKVNQFIGELSVDLLKVMSQTPRFKHCHYTETDLLTLFESKKMNLYQLVDEFVSNDPTYHLNSQGEFVVNEEGVIHQMVNQLMNSTHLSIEAVQGLMELMIQSEKGYEYYYQNLLTEADQLLERLRRINQPSVLEESLAWFNKFKTLILQLSQLHLTYTFDQRFKVIGIGGDVK